MFWLVFNNSVRIGWDGDATRSGVSARDKRSGVEKLGAKTVYDDIYLVKIDLI